MSPVIAAFGRLKTEAQEETALCSSDCSHYFAIIEYETNGNRFLRIVWTEDKNELIGSGLQQSAASAPKCAAHANSNETGVERTQSPSAGKGTKSSVEYYSVIVLDHDANSIVNHCGAWFKRISQLPELENPVTSQNEGMPDGFSSPHQGQEAVVVLHTGDGRGPGWKEKLESEAKIVRVVVVSTGGDPASKGIPRGGKFIHCDVKPDDLIDGAGRQKLLVHLQIGESK